MENSAKIRRTKSSPRFCIYFLNILTVFTLPSAATIFTMFTPCRAVWD